MWFSLKYNGSTLFKPISLSDDMKSLYDFKNSFAISDPKAFELDWKCNKDDDEYLINDSTFETFKRYCQQQENSQTIAIEIVKPQESFEYLNFVTKSYLNIKVCFKAKFIYDFFTRQLKPCREDDIKLSITNYLKEKIGNSTTHYNLNENSLFYELYYDRDESKLQVDNHCKLMRENKYLIDEYFEFIIQGDKLINSTTEIKVSIEKKEIKQEPKDKNLLLDIISVVYNFTNFLKYYSSSNNGKTKPSLFCKDSNYCNPFFENNIMEWKEIFTELDEIRKEFAQEIMNCYRDSNYKKANSFIYGKSGSGKYIYH